MTWRRWAPSALLAAIGAGHVGICIAGVWVTSPSLSIVGEYSSNPALLNATRNTGVAGGAIQVDAPTSFRDDAFKFSVLPSIRQSSSSGYSAVTSDFEHLNLASEYGTGRSTLTANAGITQDSSLAYNNLSSGTAGVRRDAVMSDLNWDQHITERIDYQLDANTQRVNFGHSSGVSPLQLVDYEYSSVAPGINWSSSERTRIMLSGAVSRYNSIDTHDAFGGRYATESRSANLQLGFVRKLGELWTFSALGGYSRALNEIDSNEYDVFFSLNTPDAPPTVEITPLRAESSQAGSIYAAQLTHKGDLLTLSAGAARQLAPTGFAFLSRQDTYEVNAGYTLSERWSFSVEAHLVRYQNSYTNVHVSGSSPSAYTRYVTASANWHWTERWVVGLAASHVSENVEFSQYNVASNEVTLSLTRTFDPITY